MPATPSSSPPPRRRRVRRWIIGSLVVAASLLLGVAIATHLYLKSDAPRRRIVQMLQRQLGINVELRKLSIGWFGDSSIQDITLSLPLAQQPIVSAPRVRFTHGFVPLVLLGRPFRLESIEIDDPVLDIRQDLSGLWNLRLAADLVMQRVRAGTAQAGTPGAGSWPAVRITDASIRITDPAGQVSTLAPVNASAGPDGQLVYRVDATAQSGTSLSAMLVPGGQWLHEAHIRIDDAQSVAKSFIPGFPADARLDAQWRGRRSGSGVAGRLQIASLSAFGASASGPVEIDASLGSVTIRPAGLLVRDAHRLLEEARVTAGAMSIDDRSIRADSLQLETADGNIQLEGAWDRIAETIDFKTAWQDLRLPDGTLHSGRIEGQYQTAFPNRPIVQATLVSNGGIDGPVGWSGAVSLVGDGESTDHINWRATATHARWRWKRTIDLSGLTLAGRSVGRSRLFLDAISLPGRGDLTGAGSADLATRDWWLWLSGNAFNLPPPRSSTLRFDFNAWGHANQATIDKAYFSAGDVELWITGSYLPNEKDAMSLSARLTHLPAFGDDSESFIRGRLRSELHLWGPGPLDMSITGMMHANGLVIGKREIGDINAKVDGRFTSDWLHLETRKLDLFGAHWDLVGRWPTFDPERVFELNIDVEDLPLSELASVLNQPGLGGRASASLDLKLRSLRLDELAASGTLHASDLVRDYIRADSVKCEFELWQGRLDIRNIDARRGDGRLHASAQTALPAPAPWMLSAKLTDWPVTDAGATQQLHLSGSTDAFQVDLSQKQAIGNAGIRGRFAHAADSIGDFDATISADGTSIGISRLAGAILNGRFDGRGRIDLARPMQSTAELSWKDLDAQKVAEWIPRLSDATGIMSGSLRAGPATGRNPIGPYQIELKLESPQGAIGGMTWQRAQATAYVGINAPGRQFHLVLPDIDLHAADGEADLLARLTIRPDGTRAAMISGSFERLDLDQLVHLADRSADPMPGRLTGQIMIAGDPYGHRNLVGDTVVTLTETDLANSDPFGLLYNLMNLGASRGMQGNGNMSARLENGNLEITRFYLANRGIEVRGVGTINDVFDVPDSRLSGFIVGTSRPLRSLRIPIFADVEEIMSKVQASATAVEIGGTVRDPVVRPTTFDSIGQGLRLMFIGDAQAQRENN